MNFTVGQTFILTCLCLLGGCKKNLDCETDLYAHFSDHQNSPYKNIDAIMQNGIAAKSTIYGSYDFAKLGNKLYRQLPQFAQRMLPPEVQIAFDRDCLFKSTGQLVDNNGNGYFFARRDSTLIAQSCFACHASVVSQTFVPGLFNNSIDHLMTAKVFDYFNILTSNQNDYVLETILSNTQKTKGQNFGSLNIFPWLFLAGYNIQNHQTMPDVMKKMQETWLYVDANPWWLHQYKKSYFRAGWLTENNSYKLANGFHQSNRPKSLEETVDSMHESIEFTSQVEQFMRSLRSPIYPHDLDADKVKLGYELYSGLASPAQGPPLNCSQCHGTYQKSKSSPWATPGSWQVSYTDNNADVGTAPEYLSYYLDTNSLVLDVERKIHPDESINLFQRLNHVAQKKYGERFFYLEDDLKKYPGYISPPLDGIWASAPYLHNGSIPTLYLLLTPEKRPLLWAKDLRHTQPHEKEVGLSYEIMDDQEIGKLKHQIESEGLFGASNVKLRSTYDTRERGQSMAGHTYGSQLSENEKYSLIEFLKSLSGPNMVAGSID